MRRVLAGALSILASSCGAIAEPMPADEVDFVDTDDTVTLTWRAPPDTDVTRIGFSASNPFTARVCIWECPRVYELRLLPPDGTGVVRARGSPFVPRGRGAERLLPCGRPATIVVEHESHYSVLETYVRCSFRLHRAPDGRWG